MDDDTTTTETIERVEGNLAEAARLLDSIEAKLGAAKGGVSRDARRSA